VLLTLFAAGLSLTPKLASGWEKARRLIGIGQHCIA